MANDGGKRSLTAIKNNPEVREQVVNLLYLKESITNAEAQFLYAVALILIDEYKKKPDSYLFIEYAYYIISKACFKVNDFRALYDFAVNYGYYPVARKIMNLNLIENPTINHFMAEISIDSFSDGVKVMTQEQNKVFRAVLDDQGKAVSFLAPTSYGKSELIFAHLNKNNDKDIVVIIVPTKALIDQVFREARTRITDRKIIIHDQNYFPENDKRLIVIVTQERALKLLDAGLVFEILYIDEAHEMLSYDLGKKLSNRSQLLVRLIKLSRKKNPNLSEVYLSPVLNSGNSLKLKNSDSISSHKIRKDLKLLDINFVDVESKVFQYDRFLGDFIEKNNVQSRWDYIRENSKTKNLHFLYRPKYIERYAELLFYQYSNVEHIPQDISDLIIELKEFVHPKYKVIKYLSKGIIYLHGRMPQVIRNYLLKFVRESQFIKHFIANSVVLAGMNLPIDNLFYVSGDSNLPNLHNLIGRVNRLNEIFSENNSKLSRIFIPVHFVDFCDDFPQRGNGNMKKKIEKLRGGFKDEVKNPFLENYDDSTRKGKDEEIKKIISDEEEVINSIDCIDFKTRFILAGAQQILNYSEEGLREIENRIANYNFEICDNDILKEIKKLFFDDFEYEHFSPGDNVKRLSKQETISYYEMFITNLKIKSLKERVEETFEYWKKKSGQGFQIYTGTQFGEVKFANESIQSSRDVYVNLDDHINDEDYLYNLAIIKLQTDEDFVGYEISLLLNAMVEFGIISQLQFDGLIYGTKSENEIKVLRLGISNNIYRKLNKDQMIQHIQFDSFGNAKSGEILDKYISDQTGIVKFELEQFFK